MSPNECAVGIHCVSFPPYIESILIYHQIEFNQRVVNCNDKRNKLKRHRTYIDCGVVMNKDENDNWDDITSPVLTLNIELLNIYSKKGKSTNIDEYQQLNSNHLIYSPKLNSHEWKLDNFNINNCSNTTSFRSAPFHIDGIDFIMEFYLKCVRWFEMSSY